MQRVLLASDAWEPQINGVVRTLQKVKEIGPSLGLDLHFVTPDRFANAPMPGYPEIRLALLHPGAFVAEFERIQPDLIHVATEGPIGLAARQTALSRHVPLTSSYHTRFPEYLAARAPVPIEWSYSALRWFHGAADAVMVSTPTLESELRARGFQNLRRWSRGVDLSLFSPRDRSDSPWPRPIFLNVGRVAVEKNLEAFLTLDLPGTKVVVGDGPQRAELEARYPEAVFLGTKTGVELAECYRQADVFVFPSRTDTFGVVMLEALASGLPVAAFPVMGPRDVIAGTQAGALSDDLREAALAALAVDRAECVRLAASYSWARSIGQFADILFEVTAKRQAIGLVPEAFRTRSTQRAAGQGMR
jgi:glycosyltransferase involved in cell wall biosynthesis